MIPMFVPRTPVAVLTWSLVSWMTVGRNVSSLQSSVKMPILTDGLTPPRAQQEAQIENVTTGPEIIASIPGQDKTKTFDKKLFICKIHLKRGQNIVNAVFIIKQPFKRSNNRCYRKYLAN